MKEYNQVRDVVTGLNIFAAHAATSCCPGHDIFFCGPKDDTPLSDTEILALLEAGWHPGDGDSGCECSIPDHDDDFDWEDSPDELRIAAVRAHTCKGWYIFM